MKNNYILKGWFKMEEFKNGAISEEALDEIAGGLKMPKITLKSALIGAGVAILAAGGAAAAATTGIVLSKKKKKKNTDSKPVDHTGIGNLRKVDMKQYRDLLTEEDNDYADVNDGEMPKMSGLDLNFFGK